MKLLLSILILILTTISTLAQGGSPSSPVTVSQLQTAQYVRCLDSRSTDDYACTLTPTISSLTTNMVVYFKANTANTGPATFNLSGRGAKSLRKWVSGSKIVLSTGDIGLGQWVQVIYDGTYWVLLGGVGGGSSGGVTSFNGRTGAVTPAANDYAFSDLSGKPTTVSGYGITNAALNGAITASGITMSTARLLGRSTASTGAIEEITVGSGLSLTAGTLAVTGGSSGADTDLANLTATAINLSLLPGVTNTIDLGSASFKWRSGYIGTSLFLANSGLKIADTNASHNLIIAAGSDVISDRTLTLTTGDADRVLQLNGDLLLTATFQLAGADDTTLNTTAATSVTLPTSGTLLADSRTISTTSPLGGGGDLSANRTLTCTTCVTSSASLTSTAVMTGAGSQGSQTPSATTTIDVSGNLSTPGYVSTGVGGSNAGTFESTEGTAFALTANAFQIYAPADVASGGLAYVLPASAATGFLLATNSSGTMTLSHVSSTGSGSVVLSAGPTLTGTTTVATLAATTLTVGGLSAAVTVASGSEALATGAISSGACATVVTDTATGTATTDTILWGFNADPTSTTGYQASANGMLTIIAYPTSNTVNFKVCNNTSSSITPGAVTLNWRVIR